MLVKDPMETRPACCVQFDTGKAAVAIMKRNGISFIPVIENETPHTCIGAVTDRDLRHEFAGGLSPDSAPCQGRPEDSLEHAMQTMRSARAGEPAVLGDQRRVVGVISLDEIAKQLMSHSAASASTAATPAEVSNSFAPSARGLGGSNVHTNRGGGEIPRKPTR